jgi:hypothetical protein
MDEIEIHQSMDSAPVINIANRDPFARAHLPPRDTDWVPNMEFTATTSHFGCPVPSTNYFWINLGINTPTENCALHTISHTTGQQPTRYAWDTLFFKVTPLEAHTFVQLQAFELLNLPHDDKSDRIVPKRPRLAAPAGRQHPMPRPSNASTN